MNQKSDCCSDGNIPQTDLHIQCSKNPSCFPQRWTRTVPDREHQNRLGACWALSPTEPKTRWGTATRILTRLQETLAFTGAGDPCLEGLMSSTLPVHWTQQGKVCVKDPSSDPQADQLNQTLWGWSSGTGIS